MTHLRVCLRHRRERLDTEPNGNHGTGGAGEADEAFAAGTQQQKVFNACCKPLVARCLQGGSGTVVTYGAWGSGKSYTLGCLYDRQLAGVSDESGLLARSVVMLFKELGKGAVVTVQAAEVCGDELVDLLDGWSQQQYGKDGSTPAAVHPTLRNSLKGLLMRTSGGGAQAPLLLTRAAAKTAGEALAILRETVKRRSTFGPELLPADLRADHNSIHSGSRGSGSSGVSCGSSRGHAVFHLSWSSKAQQASGRHSSTGGSTNASTIESEDLFTLPAPPQPHHMIAKHSRNASGDSNCGNGCSSRGAGSLTFVDTAAASPLLSSREAAGLQKGLAALAQALVGLAAAAQPPPPAAAAEAAASSPRLTSRLTALLSGLGALDQVTVIACLAGGTSTFADTATMRLVRQLRTGAAAAAATSPATAAPPAAKSSAAGSFRALLNSLSSRWDESFARGFNRRSARARANGPGPSMSPGASPAKAEGRPWLSGRSLQMPVHASFPANGVAGTPPDRASLVRASLPASTAMSPLTAPLPSSEPAVRSRRGAGPSRPAFSPITSSHPLSFQTAVPSARPGQYRHSGGSTMTASAAARGVRSAGPASPAGASSHETAPADRRSRFLHGTSDMLDEMRRSPATAPSASRFKTPSSPAISSRLLQDVARQETPTRAKAVAKAATSSSRSTPPAATVAAAAVRKASGASSSAVHQQKVPSPVPLAGRTAAATAARRIIVPPARHSSLAAPPSPEPSGLRQNHHAGAVGGESALMRAQSAVAAHLRAGPGVSPAGHPVVAGTMLVAATPPNARPGGGGRTARSTSALAVHPGRGPCGGLLDDAAAACLRSSRARGLQAQYAQLCDAFRHFLAFTSTTNGRLARPQGHDDGVRTHAVPSQRTADRAVVGGAAAGRGGYAAAFASSASPRSPLSLPPSPAALLQVASKPFPSLDSGGVHAVARIALASPHQQPAKPSPTGPAWSSSGRVVVAVTAVAAASATSPTKLRKPAAKSPQPAAKPAASTANAPSAVARGAAKTATTPAQRRVTAKDLLTPGAGAAAVSAHRTAELAGHPASAGCTPVKRPAVAAGRSAQSATRVSLAATAQRRGSLAALPASSSPAAAAAAAAGRPAGAMSPPAVCASARRFSAEVVLRRRAQAALPAAAAVVPMTSFVPLHRDDDEPPVPAASPRHGDRKLNSNGAVVMGVRAGRGWDDAGGTLEGQHRRGDTASSQRAHRHTSQDDVGSAANSGEMALASSELVTCDWMSLLEYGEPELDAPQSRLLDFQTGGASGDTERGGGEARCTHGRSETGVTTSTREDDFGGQPVVAGQRRMPHGSDQSPPPPAASGRGDAHTNGTDEGSGQPLATAVAGSAVARSDTSGKAGSAQSLTISVAPLSDKFMLLCGNLLTTPDASSCTDDAKSRPACPADRGSASAHADSPDLLPSCEALMASQQQATLPAHTQPSRRDGAALSRPDVPFAVVAETDTSGLLNSHDAALLSSNRSTESDVFGFAMPPDPTAVAIEVAAAAGRQRGSPHNTARQVMYRSTG